MSMDIHMFQLWLNRTIIILLENMVSDVEVAVLALGLGQYVVEGERAYRFCPEYPTVNIISPEEELRSTQTEFLAIALRKKEFHLLEGEKATFV